MEKTLGFSITQRVHTGVATHHPKENTMEATNTSLDEIMNQINRQNGLDALLNAREALERAIREINSHINTYQTAESDTMRAKALNWTINHLAGSLLCNCRLDLLASRQAELTTDK
ncbi:MAG: hypothetical protein J0L71_13490 [Candidatus Accumulibacter sp.]|nr:hypothetical protein [Accumulibacter sp.]MBN8518848.1 hypothetical protein [Accumulibacter sp.]